VNPKLTTPTNTHIAKALKRIAMLLERQGGNPERVRAYMAAARSIRSLEAPAVVFLASSGRQGLAQIPEIGSGIAGAIEEYAYRRRISLLDRLEGKVSPEEVFATVPGLGAKRADLIHEALGIDTLEELELAARDGRLATLPGFAQKRIETLREQLDSILSHTPRHRSRAPELMGDEVEPAPVPPARLLLEVDAEYRARAETDALPLIAPRRFNPSDSLSLPVLHTERHGWELMAMYANSGRAHRLGKTRDWVVIVSAQDGLERQHTAITEDRGALAGKRTIRGREAECATHYDGLETTPPAVASPDESSSGTSELQA
jgi:DNA polymerase (family 10)